MSTRSLCLSTTTATSTTSLWKSDRDQFKLFSNTDQEDEDQENCRPSPLIRSLHVETKALAYQQHMKWIYQPLPLPLPRPRPRPRPQPQPDPKRHSKTILPPAEMLPRNEVLGGFIFVCNNETMQDDLHRQLFGLPPKYKDSVRAIVPGLPLFLYNYTTHQLHGVYQAVSFGGSNIDPTAWQDKKCPLGGSRFPAQVRIRTKKSCKPLEEDAFRPILYHYDGPKFRLQLSVPEALALLDLFNEEDY